MVPRNYSIAQTIIDEVKGEIDMAQYFCSTEECVKIGEKLNFGRGNGRTFYSIISGPMKIKNVIFNPPATIVFWGDGSKTVVKCGENDIFDHEKGLAMAISKKLYGNKGNYYNIIKKWLPKEKIEFKEPEIMIKTCHNCLHGEKDPREHPCYMCLHTLDKLNTYWEAKEK